MSDQLKEGSINQLLGVQCILYGLCIQCWRYCRPQPLSRISTSVATFTFAGRLAVQIGSAKSTAYLTIISISATRQTTTDKKGSRQNFSCGGTGGFWKWIPLPPFHSQKPSPRFTTQHQSKTLGTAVPWMQDEINDLAWLEDNVPPLIFVRTLVHKRTTVLNIQYESAQRHHAFTWAKVLSVRKLTISTLLESLTALGWWKHLKYWKLGGWTTLHVRHVIALTERTELKNPAKKSVDATIYSDVQSR